MISRLFVDLIIIDAVLMTVVSISFGVCFDIDDAIDLVMMTDYTILY
jgi:hypothetical protein